MQDAEQDIRLAQLTAEMAWLKRLARALIRNDEAADLAHDAWLVAVEHAPEDGRPLRPWLGRIARNLTFMGGRARRRREARELATAVLAEPVPSPDQLVQRVEIQRLVACEVLRLAEPYRSTVLLHYFEELTCAEIARRLELPEGTIRRRLKVARDQLRARLDTKQPGSRGGLAALAPLAGVTAPHKYAASVAVGVLMKKVVAAIALVLVLLIAALLWSGRTRGLDKADPTVAAEHHGASTPAGSASAEGAELGLPAWLVQSGVKPRRIAGRVTFHHAPVIGATVELASFASESGLVTAPRRTTSAAGEFDFGPQPAMEWSVRASAASKASASVEVDLRNPISTPAPDHLELELGTCNAALFGTVRDASGGAIAKARIARAFESNSGVPGGSSVITDDKGTYEICVEVSWPGLVAVEASAFGYGSIVYTTIVPGRVKADFALVPEATIIGRVVRDDTGAPVPQASVYVPAGQPAVVRTSWRGTFTDATGHFRLDRVPPGRHLVFARGEGMVLSRGTVVIVEAGRTSTELEIRLEVGSTIRGTVIDHGKPVAGARVAPMIAEGRGTTAAMSQEDGTFVLTEVPRGQLRFAARPYDVVKPTTFQVSQPEHEGVMLEVDALGTIVGHVVREKKPVPGAHVDIRGPNDRELEATRTDATGRFEARGLRAGPWTLYASNEHEGSFGGPEHVQLNRGQTAEVTIDLAFSAAISGRVIDQNGEPVPGVAVWLSNTANDDAGLAVTSIDGTFRAASMSGGGQYRPSVRRNPRSITLLKPASGTEFPLVTLSGRDSEVTGIVLAVQLDRLSISGKVVDGDGAPVADTRVLAELLEHGEQPRFFSGVQDLATTTDVDGRFVMSDLLDGGYAIQARSPAGTEATVTDVRAGRGDVTIVLPTPGAIDGTLVGFRDPPQVSALKNDSPGSRSPLFATVQGTGFFMRDLSPGKYLVTARTPNEAASLVVEVSSGKTSHATLTSQGSGVVSGHVRELRTNRPIEGMTCRAVPRVGTAVPVIGMAGEGVRTDAQGAFLIPAAPAGDIAILCDGLWRIYSNGARLVTMQPPQPTDLNVLVVAWQDDAHALAGFGADLDDQPLVPQLVRVQSGGPAALAGFAQGDIVIAVDGVSTTEVSPNGVWILIANHAPGTKVKIAVNRAGKTLTADLTLRVLETR
ncbi:MAG: hypothetical protein JWO36_6354 [Myxococcales bacterium]|nr:hypothetical protein [Myxococcales bacterium]